MIKEVVAGYYSELFVKYDNMNHEITDTHSVKTVRGPYYILLC